MADKTDIAFRFRRSIDSYDENALAQKGIIQHLISVLESYCPLLPGRWLEVGCGTGLLTQQLVDKYEGCELFINDLVDAMCIKAAGRCGLPLERCLPGDIEEIFLPGEFRLIVSASTFQWLAHPGTTFARLARHIPAKGWLVFSTFGPDNFRELKMLTGEGLVYRSTEEMHALLSPYFQVVYAEESRHILEFDDPLDILRHVKKTGVNATASRQTWTRKQMEEFSRGYSVHFAQNGRFPLTYHPQYFVCRKI